ncbi:MAG: hypothetical protein HeimC2_14480 [Candidatus Heimdallarchaeota archaeon LC_2]|nr:MAG: hypothetical protein HeimC2_14480 [Candidatus Heimdallarchaeota archaeon LC_2]
MSDNNEPPNIVVWTLSVATSGLILKILFGGVKLNGILLIRYTDLTNVNLVLNILFLLLVGIFIVSILGAIYEIKEIRMNGSIGRDVKEERINQKQLDNRIITYEQERTTGVYKMDILTCCYQSTRFELDQCICGERLDYILEINGVIQTDNIRYSKILETKVLDCCYLTAELQETYCVFGRGLSYPKLKKFKILSMLSDRWQ